MKELEWPDLKPRSSHLISEPGLVNVLLSEWPQIPLDTSHIFMEIFLTKICVFCCKGIAILLLMVLGCLTSSYSCGGQAFTTFWPHNVGILPRKTIQHALFFIQDTVHVHFQNIFFIFYFLCFTGSFIRVIIMKRKLLVWGFRRP